MKQTITTEKVLRAYKILSTAKYSKLADADKVKVWKIARKMEPFATKFDNDSKDAAEKLKPYEAFADDLTKAQEYEQKKGVGCEMTAEDYQKFVAAFKSYNELVGKAIKEFADKEVELEFDVLSEDAFGKLMCSNEWTYEDVRHIDKIIVEQEKKED